MAQVNKSIAPNHSAPQKYAIPQEYLDFVYQPDSIEPSLDDVFVIDD
jgi:hypothetical protein